jgi:hypothetical protein
MPDPSLTAICQLFAPRERFVEEEKQIIQQRRKIATALWAPKGKIGHDYWGCLIALTGCLWRSFDPRP